MVTLFNMLEQDHELFEHYVLPDGMDRDLLTDTILSRWGGMDTVYVNPKIFRYYHETWFRRKFEIIKKMYESTLFEYNPIENYDRKEDYWENNDDTLDVTTNDSTDASLGQTEKTETENTSQVSPFNAETFLNDSKSNGSENTTTDQNRNETVTGKRDEINNREKKGGLRAHGNIGVTTTQEMIEQERRVAQFDIYEWCADLWADDMLVIIW